MIQMTLINTLSYISLGITALIWLYLALDYRCRYREKNNIINALREENNEYKQQIYEAAHEMAYYSDLIDRHDAYDQSREKDFVIEEDSDRHEWNVVAEDSDNDRWIFVKTFPYTPDDASHRSVARRMAEQFLFTLKYAKPCFPRP